MRSTQTLYVLLMINEHVLLMINEQTDQLEMLEKWEPGQ